MPIKCLLNKFTLGSRYVLGICPSSRAWWPCWLKAAEGHAQLFQEPVAATAHAIGSLVFLPPTLTKWWQRAVRAAGSLHTLCVLALVPGDFLVPWSSIRRFDGPPVRDCSCTAGASCNLLHPEPSPAARAFLPMS